MESKMYTATAIELLKDVKRSGTYLSAYDVGRILILPCIHRYLSLSTWQDLKVRKIVEEMGFLFDSVKATIEYPLS